MWFISFSTQKKIEKYWSKKYFYYILQRYLHFSFYTIFLVRNIVYRISYRFIILFCVQYRIISFTTSHARKYKISCINCIIRFIYSYFVFITFVIVITIIIMIYISILFYIHSQIISIVHARSIINFGGMFRVRFNSFIELHFTIYF